MMRSPGAPWQMPKARLRRPSSLRLIETWVPLPPIVSLRASILLVWFFRRLSR